MNVAASLEHYDHCRRAVKCCADIRDDFNHRGEHDRIDRNSILYTLLLSSVDAVNASCTKCLGILAAEGLVHKYGHDYIEFLGTGYAYTSHIAVGSMLVAPIRNIAVQQTMNSFLEMTNRVRNPFFFPNAEPHLSFATIWNPQDYDDRTATAMVEAMYCRVLQRPPESLGAITYWTEYLRKGSTCKDMLRRFLLTPEFASRFVNGKLHETVAHRLYDAVLARAPDAGGLVHWTKELGVFGLENVVDRFLASEEYNNRVGDHAVPGGGRAGCSFVRS